MNSRKRRKHPDEQPPVPRKKSGIFTFARFSDPIFQDLPEEVVEGVNRDIASLVKSREPITAERKSRPGRKEERCLDVSLLMSPTPREPVREPARGEQRWNNARMEPSIFDSREELTTHHTPTRQSSSTSAVPMREIVDRMMLSFPKITLRDDEPMTYSQAVISMGARVLNAGIERGRSGRNDKHPNASLSQLLPMSPPYSRRTFHRTVTEEEDDEDPTLHLFEPCANYVAGGEREGNGEGPSLHVFESDSNFIAVAGGEREDGDQTHRFFEPSTAGGEREGAEGSLRLFDCTADEEKEDDGGEGALDVDEANPVALWGWLWNPDEDSKE